MKTTSKVIGLSLVFSIVLAFAQVTFAEINNGNGPGVSIPVSISNGGTATSTGGNTGGVNYYDGTEITNNPNLIYDGNTGMGLGNAKNIQNGSGFQYSSSTNSFIQDVVWNTNGGNNASGDYILQNDLTDAAGTKYFGDFFMLGSQYSQGTVESGSDIGLNNSDGNLWLETASTTGPANIGFVTKGDGATSNIRMYITSAGKIGIGTTTPITALAVNNEPLGNGTIATTTLQVGDISTTTARSSIQMVNTTGASECLYLVGTTVTVTAGTCK